MQTKHIEKLEELINENGKAENLGKLTPRFSGLDFIFKE